MGYDCTLHVVDEKQISETFVEALLAGRNPAKGTAADAGVEDEYWSKTFKSLAEDPPEHACSTVCQLALIFSSKRQPYHYERGFALCLWPDQPDGLGATFPKELTDSPEILFKNLIKRYPSLKGKFPNEFSGNWSTGTFISSKKVTKALKWVEKRIQQFDEGDRELFRGLLLVLRYCTKYQLAYWEGTDLGLPMATLSAEGNEARRAACAFKWPDHGYEPLARHGSLFVCRYGLGPSKEAKTALADFSQWPPKLEWLAEYAIHASVSRCGKLLTIASNTIRVRDSFSATSQPKELSVPNTKHVGDSGYYWADFIGEQSVGLLGFSKGKTPQRYPLFDQGGVLLEDRSFAPAKDNHHDHWGMEWMRVGVAETGSGAQVFIWRHDGYEQKGNKFEKTFSLVEGDGLDTWTSVPAGPDGFFYLSNRRLYEIHRGATSIPHLPKLGNVMHLRSGPGDSLLLKEGDNKSGDWGKLYWPQSKQWVRLTPDLLTDVPKDAVYRLYWLDSLQRLLVFTAEEVWFVPLQEIEKLPRTKV